MPKRLVPDYIRRHVDSYEVRAHTAPSYVEKVEEEYGYIFEQANDIYYDMMQDIASIPLKVDLPNGRYHMHPCGEVFKDYHKWVSDREDTIMTVSMKFLEDVRAVIDRATDEIIPLKLHDRYSEAGGCKVYVSAPINMSDFRYFHALVDEGTLYLINYQYNQ